MKNLLVVYMKSRYEIYQDYLVVDKNQKLQKFLKQSAEGEHLQQLHNAHNELLKKIIHLLGQKNISYNLCYRADLRQDLFSFYDCVMAVGGDGTFLETASYIKNETPIIGVNSAIYYDEKLGKRRGSEGAYTAMDPFDFEEKFNLFLEGKLQTTCLDRLVVEYNAQRLDHLVLNEVSVGPSNPHRAMNYIIRTPDFEEEQTSSGLIIATAQTPWPLAYPGGSVLQFDKKMFQAVTRANYNSRHNLDKGEQKRDGIIIKHPNWIEVESKDRTATIALDGEHRQFPFSFGDKIKVYLSSTPLNVLGFNTERQSKYYNVKRQPMIRIIE